MSLGDSLALLFRLEAKDNASAVVAGAARNITRETTALQGGFSKAFGVIQSDVAGATGRFGTLAAAFGPVGLGLAATTGAAAIAVGGLFKLAEHTAEVGSQFHDLSIQTGLSVETLSGLSTQLKQSGTDVDQLALGNFNLQKSQEAARDGSKEMRAALKELGVDLNATSETALRQLVKGLADSTDEGHRNALGAQVMGKAYRELAVFIQDTNGDIDAVIEKARAAGEVMSAEAANAADEFDDRLDGLSNRLTLVSANIGSVLIPGIITAIDEIGNALSFNAGNWQDWSNRTINAIGGAYAAVMGFRAAVTHLPSSIAAGIQGGAGAGLGAFFGSTAGNFAVGEADASKSYFDTALRLAQSGGGKSRATGGGSRGGGGGKGKGKDETQQQDLKQLQIFNKELEEVTKQHREILQREYDLGITQLEDYTTRAKEENEQHYSEQLRGFTREEEIIRAHAKNKRDLQLKLDELDLKRDDALDDRNKENQRLDDEKIKRQQESALALNRQLADIRESFRKGEEDKIEEAQKRGYLSESVAEQTLLELLKQGFEDRKTLLEMELAQQYLTLDKRTEINNALIKLESDRANAVEEATRRVLDAAGKELASRVPDRKVGNQTAAQAAGKLLSDKQVDAIGSPALSGWDMFRKTATEALRGVGDVGTEVGGILGGVFQRMADGVGQAVGAWVLFGNAGGGFRKMAAEVIASIAQMAVVQSIFEAAQGLAMLALTYFTGNPKYAASAGGHFAAAAAFGLIGGVAAVAGRGLAGSSLSQGASAGIAAGVSGSGGGTSERDRRIVEGRSGGSTNPYTPQAINVHINQPIYIAGEKVDHFMTKLVTKPTKFRDELMRLNGYAPA